MNNEQKILSGEQTKLVVDLTETYGIKPEDIIFFSNSPEPFFGYEANCILLNRLTDVIGIELEPVPSVAGDAISTRCKLTFPDDKKRSGVGVANLAETLNGEKMSEEQTRWLSEARAIRIAVRTAGINLVQLHQERKGQPAVSMTGTTGTNRASLLAQAHTLGRELGFIFDDENGPVKTLWYRVIANRYDVGGSNELDDHRLADFVAFLRSIRPAKAKAAA